MESARSCFARFLAPHLALLSQVVIGVPDLMVPVTNLAFSTRSMSWRRQVPRSRPACLPERSRNLLSAGRSGPLGLHLQLASISPTQCCSTRGSSRPMNLTSLPRFHIEPRPRLFWNPSSLQGRLWQEFSSRWHRNASWRALSCQLGRRAG